MSAVDTIRDAILGNPPTSDYKPSQYGLLAGLTEMFQLIQNVTLGIKSFATVAMLPADTTIAPVGTQARVYADSTLANNTYWIRKAASGTNNGWAIDTDLIATLTAVVQPLVDAANAALGQTIVARDVVLGTLAQFNDYKSTINNSFFYTIDPLTQNIVTEVDDELCPTISYDKTTGALVVNGTGSGTSAVRPEFPDMSTPHLMMFVGQSWGVPNTAQGVATSTSASVYPGALMPNGGVFNTAGYAPSDWQSFVPLRETWADEQGVRETPVSGFIRYAFSYAAEKLGQRVDTWQIIGYSVCNSGKALSFFLPGDLSGWFDGPITSIIRRFAVMAPNCGGITIPTVFGGADTSDGTSKTDFKDRLRIFVNAFQTLCDQTWGRPMAIRFLMYPPTRYTALDTGPISAIVEAHLEFAREDARAEIVMAPYYNEYKTDRRHWTANGAKRFGMTGGRSAAQWYAKRHPRAMELRSVTRRIGETIVRVHTDPLTSPARINITDQAATPDQGFTLYGSDGVTVVPITDVTVDPNNGSDVLVAFTGTNITIKRCTYAIGKAAPGTNTGTANGDEGQRGTGNISDSTIASVVIGTTTYSLPNFLTQFDESVLEVNE